MIKRITAILLSMLMLVGCFGVGLVGVSAARTPIPTVYVQGQGHAIFKDAKDGSSEVLTDYFDASILTDNFGTLSDLLLDAYKKNDFTAYNNYLVDMFSECYADLVLDKNGDVSNGSGNDCLQTVPNYNSAVNGTYGCKDYYFYYDWRLDPVVLAEQLNTYIDTVLSATGASKVNVIARCLGGNIVLAYMHEYGSNKINRCCFYAVAFEGVDVLGALFSGKVVVNSDSLERFMNVKAASDPTNEFYATIRAFISLANTTFALDIGVKELLDVYDKIYEDVVPRMVKASFGTFPSYWSMVGDDYFEDAVKFNYGNDPEYTEMVRKITYYHNEIFKNTKKILDDAQKSGVQLYFVSKYGGVAVPVYEKSEEQNDSYVRTASMAMGCKVAGIEKTFSDAYIGEAEKKGTAKYISVDRQIDASECYCADHTWFIKDLTHKLMPDSVDDLIMNLFAADSYISVGDAYPQYYKFDNGTQAISPLTAENQKGDTEQNFESDKNADAITVLDVISAFFDKIAAYFNDLIDKIVGLFGQLANLGNG